MSRFEECKGTLYTYRLEGELIDSLDLKILIITKGINILPKVFEIFGKSNRISPYMEACNCMILPDRAIVHLTNVGPMSPFTFILQVAHLCWRFTRRTPLS